MKTPDESMRIHIRIYPVQGEHQRVQVFVNGANTGTLTMRVREAERFSSVVEFGCGLELSTTGESGQTEFLKTQIPQEWRLPEAKGDAQ